MKDKSGISMWILGLIIIGSVLIGKDFFPLLGITISTSMFYIIFLIGIILITIDFIDIFKPKDEIDKFFQNVGLVEAIIIRKEVKPLGYDIYIKLPVGKSLADFTKQQEALEQYLNSQVCMSYVNKSIKISVTGKKLS